MFCWERAVQLRRDALPALEAANVGLAVVGIGSLDAGETFASRTEFPKSMLYVDDSDESEAYRAAGTRNTKRKPDGKADFEGIGSMWSQSTNDALKARGKADLDTITASLFKPAIYTPLMPKGSTMTRSMEKTMVRAARSSSRATPFAPVSSVNPHRHAVAAICRSMACSESRATARVLFATH